ncbi:hypothetical protein N9O04_00155 [Pelagibacteraceae bacterium]|nr:hypothetical protein [Pelagibacteraceae bacterium]
MNKILIAIITSMLISSAAIAGQYGIGVTGSFAAVSADGSEADKDGTADTSVRNAEASEKGIVPSVFLEYTFDSGFTLGYDYTIGSADVNSKKITRTDDSSEANQDGDRSAEAEIDNVMAIYAEVPLHAGLYAKGGFVQMDVNTKDTFSGTLSGAYGNETVDGMMYGLGYKNSFGSNGFYKIEGTFTDMDSMTFQSSTTDKGNKVTADLDVTKATLAVGYNF